jgi:tetratricopeptide (TPR) repeat protein
MSGRPVVNFSFGLSYAISGDAVWSYHVFNLLVHVAAGLVLFGIVRRTLLQPALAPRFGAHATALGLLTALLWTLHPLQTESVTFISQRAEAMLGLLYLLTIWFFIRALEPGAPAKWTIAAVVTCALGMVTKEVMVSAPIFAALYDRAFVAGSWREVWRAHRRLLLALAGTWLVLAAVVVHEGGARGASAGFGLGVSPWTYLLTQCEAITVYLKLSFWPHPLVLDYGIWLARSVAEVWWQGLLIGGLLVATVWALVRRPMLGCLGAWFFMILAPSSSVVPLVGQTIAEHRMYLPLAAVMVLVVISSYWLFGPRALVGLAVAAGGLAVGTELRNRDYASAISICEDTAAKRPDNARVRALLADYYRRAGRLDEARRQLERSLELEPGVFPVLNNLGTVWQELGEPGKAVGYFAQALQKHPGDVTTLNNLGNALVVAGRVDEGIAELAAAVRAAPGAEQARFNLASALAQNGRPVEASEQFAEYLRLQPRDAEAHNRYSSVLTALGRKAEALAELQAAVAAAPDNADLHNRLGTALGRAGRLPEALEQFEAALRLNPAHAAAQQNADRARRLLGRN